jgi:hypothetical protein
MRGFNYLSRILKEKEIKNNDENKECTFHPEILKTKPDFDVNLYSDKSTKIYYDRQYKAKLKKEEIEEKLKPKCKNI